MRSLTVERALVGFGAGRFFTPASSTRPSAMSRSSEFGASTGTSLATGRPWSVTVTVRPARTSARWRLNPSRNSRTPMFTSGLLVATLMVTHMATCGEVSPNPDALSLIAMYEGSVRALVSRHVQVCTAYKFQRLWRNLDRSFRPRRSMQKSPCFAGLGVFAGDGCHQPVSDILRTGGGLTKIDISRRPAVTVGRRARRSSVEVDTNSAVGRHWACSLTAGFVTERDHDLLSGRAGGRESAASIVHC